MTSLIGRLANLLLVLFGRSSPAGLLTQAEIIMIEATEALVRNLAEVGVKDGARFIADARELSKQVNAQNASGTAKLAVYRDAAFALLVDLGGDLKHTLTVSIINTFSELLHQPDAGTPPATIRTLGSTTSE